jgi:uncharacterized protein
VHTRRAGMTGPFKDWRATALFFGMAYAIAWAAWITLFTLRLSHLAGIGICIYLLAVLAPHGAAVAVTMLESGRAGLRDYYARVFRRAPIRWLVISLVVPPGLYLVSQLIAVTAQMPHESLFHQPARTLPMLILGQSAVALGEEPGWRGFALPRLVQGWGPITGSLILGIAWSLWHLPLFMVAGTAQYGTPFLPFLATLTAWSVLMALLVARARGSVVVAMLFHASGNLCDLTMWQPDAWPLAIGPWIGAATLAAWLMRRDVVTWA